MLTVGQLRKVIEGMESDRPVMVQCGDWIYATAYAGSSVLTQSHDGHTFENLGPRTPGDIDVLLLPVVE